MAKAYLHSGLKSMSVIDKMSPTPTPAYLLHNSHSQRLDALLDELEIEYYGKMCKDTVKEKATQDEMNADEAKLWESVNYIKKHNTSYRKAVPLLNDLQKQQRWVKNTGLLPASATVSATSCSSLELDDPGFSEFRSICTEGLKLPPRQIQTKQKSPFSCTSKRVKFNAKNEQYDFKPVPPPTTISPKIAIEVIQTPSPIPPMIYPPPTFATPTKSSTAKVRSKSKSKLTKKNSCEIPASSTITPNRNRDENLNLKLSVPTDNVSWKTVLQTNKQKKVLPPSRIPTAISRNRITATIPKEHLAANKSVLKPSSLKTVTETVKPTSSHKLPQAQIKPETQKQRTTSITSGNEGSGQSQGTTLTQNQPENGVDALEIIRSLLQHANDAAITLFKFDGPDGLLTDGNESTASNATYTLDKNANSIANKKSSLALDKPPNNFDKSSKSSLDKNPSNTLDKNIILQNEAQQEFINQAPNVKMIFGVPYIPGAASKFPKLVF